MPCAIDRTEFQRLPDASRIHRQLGDDCEGVHLLVDTGNGGLTLENWCVAHW